MSNKIEYKGHTISTEETGVWIISNHAYITACGTVEDCKELIDEMVDKENIMLVQYINMLGKSAEFRVSGDDPVYGYVTDIKIHKVDGEVKVFVGGNYNNVEGIALTYFNPNEVFMK